MNHTLKLALYGVAAVLLLIVGARLLAPVAGPAGTGETEAIVSKLIANDPLIAPVATR